MRSEVKWSLDTKPTMDKMEVEQIEYGGVGKLTFDDTFLTNQE